MARLETCPELALSQALVYTVLSLHNPESLLTLCMTYWQTHLPPSFLQLHFHLPSLTFNYHAAAAQEAPSMSRRSNVPNGSEKNKPASSPLPCNLWNDLRPRDCQYTELHPAAEDKQKRLLEEETGHFSMIRALHLADLITLGNGTFSTSALL